jgi:cellobiose phosphorylase
MIIKNTLGLSVSFLENGSIKSIEANPIRISLKPATPFSKLAANIYLRKRTKHIEYTPLFGPESNSHFTIHNNIYIAKGQWEELDYTVILQLSPKSMSWQWTVEVRNLSGNQVELDVIYVQDLGLKPITDGLINGYYVSQYTERLILEHQVFGVVACCRQNMKESVRHPWFMMACGNGAVAGSTDGIQFYGRSFRATGIPEGLLSDKLDGEYAGESSIIALQEKPFTLAADEGHSTVFVATYLLYHPEATSTEDLKRLPGTMSEFEEVVPMNNKVEWTSPARNLFNTAPFLPAEDLEENELDRFFGKEKRQKEEIDGHLLSFFSGTNDHVVLMQKEILTDRPHGHILQAKAGLEPDESIVSTTAWAYGVFNSHLKQGNTNFNVLLSICSSPFNLALETGQRIFVQTGGKNFLLGVPSAFEMGLNHCRWIYKSGGHCFRVRTWTSKQAPQVNTDFKVISGPPVQLLITNHFDELNGWTLHPDSTNGEYVLRPKYGSMIAGKFPQAQYRMVVNSKHENFRVSGDEVLFDDNKSRSSLFVVAVSEVTAFCMSFIGEVCSSAEAVKIENADQQWLSDCRDAQSDWQQLSLKLSLKSDNQDIESIQEILPWYGMNALTHFLTPYGLEQFGGSAWGTRDVAQGPVDLLLAMGKYGKTRKVLCIIFSNQNPDGGWPQWWMFDSYREIRAGESHADIFYWCILALSKYVLVTGDIGILGEILPYYHEKGVDHAEKTPLSEHVDRLIKMITGSFVSGTSLVPFGGGDWNDSLQPVSEELAKRMISSWTVEMNYQAFKSLSTVYAQTGQTDKVTDLVNICEQIKADFNTYLIRDDVVAGYGLVEKDNRISLLLHPSDTKTGIRYSILPMERGILSGIFTKEQALHHQELIEMHLKGPDGARLMDRPLKYKGGIQEIFQRAESSTFFGREIGLMYVHEHIRYTESLALTGKAESFLKALRQAIPVGYREIVPCGDIRQSNCYYSSSDVHFKNRYEADERYDDVIAGRFTLRGGWRVYSSGPGIYIGLIVTRLLGIRIESGNVIIDPVMPFSLDGLSASMNFMGYPVTFKYAVRKGNFSPSSISVNGQPTGFSYEDNKYRQGGAVIPVDGFIALLDHKDNVVEIRL